MSVLMRIGAQLFQKLVVDQPAFFFEQIADVGEENLMGFLQTLLQPAENAERLRRLRGFARRLFGSARGFWLRRLAFASPEQQRPAAFVS